MIRWEESRTINKITREIDQETIFFDIIKLKNRYRWDESYFNKLLEKLEND